MDASEAAILQRCRRGDKEAFGEIVKRYAGPATGAATLLLGSRDDALDASQEAFVRAWRHIRRFDPARPFYPWYATILRNICISRLRRRTRRKTVELPDGHPDGRRDASPEALVERSERKDRLWHAVGALPLHHREILVLYHFQDLAYREIADALGVPIGTVMSRLHNARRALREKLAGELP